MSHGKKIEVIRATPKQEGKYPAVLWLPGIDGINKDNREALTGVVNRLAQKGYVVHMVCYTDCFAGKESELDHFKVRAQDYLVPPKGSGSASGSEDSKRLADAWQDCIKTIDDGIRNVRRDPLVDKNRVGIVGMSLGSATGLVLASRPENGIKAFICMSGCVPPHVDLKATARTLPPLMVLHGKQDPIIPVRMAEELFDAMPKEARDKGVHVKTIFEKGGHLFIDPQTKELQLADALFAEMAGAKFLKEHLQDNTDRPLK
jgi:dienelactone hydrolase